MYNQPPVSSDPDSSTGLWPDFCDGKFPAFCDKKREYSNITKIMKASRDPQAASTLAEMNALFKSGGGYGTDESLQSHEWVKHVRHSFSLALPFVDHNSNFYPFDFIRANKFKVLTLFGRRELACRPSNRAAMDPPTFLVRLLLIDRISS